MGGHWPGSAARNEAETALAGGLPARPGLAVYLFPPIPLYALLSGTLSMGNAFTGPDKHRFVVGIAAKYSDRLRRFLRSRLPNPSDVHDLAQEVFLRLLRAPNHEDIRSPEAYLFTVASHVVQQHHQKQATAPASLEWFERFGEESLASADSAVAGAEFHERLEHLERTLDGLPPRAAMALLMQRVGGHSIGEIARELGVAEITVKKDLARALAHCRGAAGEMPP